jgi:GNAT superfamily N-acetyltransferase
MTSKLANFLATIIALVFTIDPSFASPARQHHEYSIYSIQNVNFTLRPAQSTDLPSISNTVLDAFDPGVINTYMYQFRSLYPDFHIRCYEEEVERRWVNAINVDRHEWWNAIVPDGERDVRSFALWGLLRREEADAKSSFNAGPWLEMNDLESLVNVPAQALQDITRTPVTDGLQHHLEDMARLPDIEAPCRLHLDMNIIRALHLLRQLQAADAKYIRNAFETQLYLGVLATHPDWDGHGFGAAQLEWGMDLARRIQRKLRDEESDEEIKVPITLLATPAGYPLYRSVGFNSIANITLELLDGVNEGSSWYEYMVWYGED